MTLMKEGASVCAFVINEYDMVPNVSFALLSGTYFSYEDSIVAITHSSTAINLFPELSKHFSCWIGLGLSTFTELSLVSWQSLGRMCRESKREYKARCTRDSLTYS